MESESWLFDEMTIGMVRVVENAGNLAAIMDQVATFREQSSQLQDRVLSAIIYPTIVFFVSEAIKLFLRYCLIFFRPDIVDPVDNFSTLDIYYNN